MVFLAGIFVTRFVYILPGHLVIDQFVQKLGGYDNIDWIYSGKWMTIKGYVTLFAF